MNHCAVCEKKQDTRSFEERYSSCFTDFAIKIGTGILIGSMIKSFFLRGLPAFGRVPIIVGGGMGFGMAYSNCENSLNGYLQAMHPKVCNIKKQP